MSWFARHRQEWIFETLRVFGYINRGHVMKKFGVSAAQAAVDFRQFLKENPGTMEYDKSGKRYVATAAF